MLRWGRRIFYSRALNSIIFLRYCPRITICTRKASPHYHSQPFETSIGALEASLKLVYGLCDHDILQPIVNHLSIRSRISCLTMSSQPLLQTAPGTTQQRAKGPIVTPANIAIKASELLSQLESSPRSSSPMSEPSYHG